MGNFFLKQINEILFVFFGLAVLALTSGCGANIDSIRAESAQQSSSLTDRGNNNNNRGDVTLPANLPPIAEAGEAQSIGFPLSSVVLQGSGSDSDGSIQSILWSQTAGPAVATITQESNFVAGASNLQAGTYTFMITVTDDRGDTATDTVDITVRGILNTPPIANAGGPYQATPNQTLTLNASGSSDPDGTIVNYNWDFGDGNTTDSTVAMVQYAYAAAGVYDVTLTVTDDDGDQSFALTQVNVVAANLVPTANAGGPYNVVVGNALTVNGGASADPDGNIVSYTWDFGDGTVETVVTATHTHTYLAAGVYVVQLTVIDNQGAMGSATTVVTVAAANVAPVAVAGGPYNGDEGNNIQFSAQGSVDPDGNIASYTWDFGDGTVVNRNNQNVNHSYDTAGVYTVTLTVTDNMGATGTDTAVVTVVDD